MSSAQTTFSSGDIAKIIKACGENGVECFEFRGLKLQFLTKTNESNNNIVSAKPIQSLDTTPSASEQAIESEIDEAYENDAFHINDPLGFENEMILARRRDSEDA